MRLPRMTISGLMVAVAVVAVLIALPVRRSRLRTLARSHAAQAGISVYYLVDNGRYSLTYRREEVRRISPARFKWHRTLCLKYYRASDNPWLPVAPDPPEPR